MTGDVIHILWIYLLSCDWQWVTKSHKGLSPKCHPIPYIVHYFWSEHYRVPFGTRSKSPPKNVFGRRRHKTCAWVTVLHPWLSDPWMWLKHISVLHISLVFFFTVNQLIGGWCLCVALYHHSRCVGENSSPNTCRPQLDPQVCFFVTDRSHSLPPSLLLYNDWQVTIHLHFSNFADTLIQSNLQE